MRWWAALLAATLCLRAAQGSEEDARLMEWVTGIAGGTAALAVGRACPGCPRGAIAFRAFQPGDEVARLPLNSSLELGIGSTAEQAHRLFERLRLHAVDRPAFKDYAKALPAYDELLAPQLFTPEDVAALQTPELERLVRRKVEEVEAVWREEGSGPADMTEAKLKHMAAVVHTRTFNLLGGKRLVPIFDLCNHSEEPNLEYKATRDVNGTQTWLRLLALRPIAPGEELTVLYKKAGLRRPDAALFQYGFLPPAADPPLLCTVDLPYYWLGDPWRPTGADDERYVPSSGGTWLSDWRLRHEHARLSALLAAVPTSEREDEALLRSGRLEGWKAQLLVRFRLQRKRALRHALQRMEAAWAAAHPGTTLAGARAACAAGALARARAAAADAAAAALHWARWFALAGRWQEPDVVALSMAVFTIWYVTRYQAYHMADVPLDGEKRGAAGS